MNAVSLARALRRGAALRGYMIVMLFMAVIFYLMLLSDYAAMMLPLIFAMLHACLRALLAVALFTAHEARCFFDALRCHALPMPRRGSGAEVRARTWREERKS